MIEIIELRTIFNHPLSPHLTTCFIGENMNYFLNQNWREVTKELGPAIGEAIGEVFRLLLTNIADLVPYEYIYPDTPANTTSTTTSKPDKAP